MVSLKTAQGLKADDISSFFATLAHKSLCYQCSIPLHNLLYGAVLNNKDFYMRYSGLILLLLPLITQAAVYKWIDDEGNV
ncbi:MAG: hypothetical protein KJP15_02025, partial [Gammaproteobacteria bacterium]|nr:hypothetical protein [Gammaproteobacteria bacterium]